jgi:folate-dependent phosphoribosylglycinamide formyltransferase PurN
MKIGVFLLGSFIKNYEVDELQNLLKTKNKFTFFICKDQKNNPKKFSLFRLIFFHSFYSIILIERKFAELFRKKYSFSKELDKMNQKISINKLIPNINKYQKYNFKMKKFENRYCFDSKTQKIIKKKCDICILLGLNKIFHSKMLNISRKGILSFHTADTNFYRGRPSAFHEFVNNAKFGGVTLQRLSKDLDRGEIIYKKITNISKCRSVEETLCKMMKLKKNMLVKGIQIISTKNKFSVSQNSHINLEKDSKKFVVVLKCLIKTIYRRYIN